MTGRPEVPRVPKAVQGVLKELGDPRRASILLALEQSPRTAREIADDLGIDGDAVQYALKRLRTCGLITVVESRKISERQATSVYATTRDGWAKILESIAAVAGGS